jgi:uncharacterized protein YecE (DUF72 family)
LRLHLGTSGFAYKEWRGSFYPQDLPADGMLRFYATRLSSVEINNTFYRMPSPALLERWGGEVPEGFDFVLKAPRRITHVKRLRDVAADVRHLEQVASTLGGKLGPLFYQLPPTFRKDLTLLQDLLTASTERRRTAFEFRHPSWEGEDTWALLSEHGAALCLAESDEAAAPAIPAGGSWGYLRLRRQEYAEAGSDRVGGEGPCATLERRLGLLQARGCRPRSRAGGAFSRALEGGSLGLMARRAGVRMPRPRAGPPREQELPWC